MNYRHAFHAGNFADVMKHLAVMAIIRHLVKKDAPFVVIDTHAGRGLYDIAGEEASRTGEANKGIGRLEGLSGTTPLLEAYLEIVHSCGRSRYPGSPLIAARSKRSEDRLVAIEKHPEEEKMLASVLAPFGKCRAVLADGYARLPALLPPPERRGLILLDPPYEASDELRLAARAFAAAYRRFATGIFVLWFPLKSEPEAAAFCGEIIAGGVAKAVRIDIDVAPQHRGPRATLTAAGLIVVNPPYGFDAEMRDTLTRIAPRLGENLDIPARTELRWLAGDA